MATLAKNLTPMAAIREMCMQCQGVPKGGNKQPITDCLAGPGSVQPCPLFGLRPGARTLRRNLSPEQVEALRERGRALAARKRENQ